MTFSPKLPLIIDIDENYQYINTINLNLRQKLKMILMTNPGEKIMDPLFGVGIKKYLFEAENGFINVEINNQEKNFFINDYKSELEGKIKQQCAKYSPDIKINLVEVSVIDRVIFITINFSFEDFITDTLTISSNDI